MRLTPKIVLESVRRSSENYAAKRRKSDTFWVGDKVQVDRPGHAAHGLTGTVKTVTGQSGFGAILEPDGYAHRLWTVKLDNPPPYTQGQEPDMYGPNRVDPPSARVDHPLRGLRENGTVMLPSSSFRKV